MIQQMPTVPDTKEEGMEFQVDGKWMSKDEADRRMMYNALLRIAGLRPDAENAKLMGEIASDTLGFVGELDRVDA